MSFDKMFDLTAGVYFNFYNFYNLCCLCHIYNITAYHYEFGCIVCTVVWFIEASLVAGSPVSLGRKTCIRVFFVVVFTVCQVLQSIFDSRNRGSCMHDYHTNYIHARDAVVK